MDGDYIIVGDTGEYKDCLVYVCGTYENAEKVLSRLLESCEKSEYSNLRIKFVESGDCWWRFNLD